MKLGTGLEFRERKTESCLAGLAILLDLSLQVRKRILM